MAVYSAHAEAGRRLRLHVAEIDPATQAALLRLDPIGDREEYAALAALLASHTPPTLQALTRSHHPEARHLSLRITNLGVDRFAVWARGQGARSWTQSTIRASGAWLSTWARCPPARSSHWWPGRCSAICGAGARSAARS